LTKTGSSDIFYFMATANPAKNEINNLKTEYDRLAKDKESYLKLRRRESSSWITPGRPSNA
jgi:hypothetical protein